MKKKSKTILFTLITIASLFVVQYAVAQVDTGTIAEVNRSGLVPCGGPTQHKCTFLDMFSLVGRLINFLIAIAGFFAVFQIVRAGFSMVFAMGDSSGITKAKEALTNTILGLVLVMMAYLIVNAVIAGVLGLKYSQILSDPFGYLCTNPTTDSSGKKIINCY